MTTIQQFNPLSLQLTQSLSKTTKKSQGIYFTPKSIINQLVHYVIPLIDSTESPIHILEPSCGSCEFILALDELLTNALFTAIEYNTEIYNEIIKLRFKNPVQLLNTDFIQYNHKQKYNLIIGNPPYFVCNKSVIPASYKQYISGRPNMFGLFIIHSLLKLRPNGILAFVIPKSFLNSAYYANIRNFIKKTCSIITIQDYDDCNDFLDTDQSTFGLILRKLECDNEIISNCAYSVLMNDNYIFTPNSELLLSYIENSTTLQQLCLAVKTGTVVWNEKKELLTDNDSDTILLYNTNITNDNKVKLTKFKNDEKGQYIMMEGSTDPIIVVNRGNGNAKYNFKYALINNLPPFLIENHLNIIYSPEKKSHTELNIKYNLIIRSFNNPKTKAFIELFFGNNGLSKTELETILPIYL